MTIVCAKRIRMPKTALEEVRKNRNLKFLPLIFRATLILRLDSESGSNSDLN